MDLYSTPREIAQFELYDWDPKHEKNRYNRAEDYQFFDREKEIPDFNLEKELDHNNKQKKLQQNKIYLEKAQDGSINYYVRSITGATRWGNLTLTDLSRISTLQGKDRDGVFETLLAIGATPSEENSPLLSAMQRLIHTKLKHR